MSPTSVIEEDKSADEINENNKTDNEKIDET